MENVCRVCCCSDSELVDIFEPDPDHSDKSYLANMLIECVDCDIRPDDCFPQKICTACVLDTQNAYKFKQRYEQSHQHFCKLLEKKGKVLKDCQLRRPQKSNLSNNNAISSKWIEKGSNGNWKVQDIKYDMHTEEDKEFAQQAKDENIQPKEDEAEDVIWLDSADEADSNDDQNDPNSSYSDVFQCHTCQQGFSNETNLVLHSLSHYTKQQEECPLCDKVFNHRRSLRRHILTHSGERPFKCPECDKGFKTKDLQTKHMRTHTGERPFVCPHCQKAFAQNGTLKKHIALHSRPFACNVCPKSFLTALILKRHQDRHEKTGRPTPSKKCSRLSVEPKTEDEDSLMID